MPPSKEHEDAVILVRESLRAEFNLNDNPFIEQMAFFDRLRPDIAIRNPKTGKIIVVEIGTTEANKISRYFKMKHIEEIRWYTKYRKEDVHLVGRWQTDTTPEVALFPKTSRVKLMEQELKKQKKEIERQFRSRHIYMDAFVCCGGCGRYVTLGSIEFAEYRGRAYGVCPACKEAERFNTVSELEKILTYYGQRTAK